MPLPTFSPSCTSWLRCEMESTDGFGGAPVVLNLALEAGTWRGFQLCPEWLGTINLSSACRAQRAALFSASGF